MRQGGQTRRRRQNSAPTEQEWVGVNDQAPAGPSKPSSKCEHAELSRCPSVHPLRTVMSLATKKGPLLCQKLGTTSGSSGATQIVITADAGYGQGRRRSLPSEACVSRIANLF